MKRAERLKNALRCESASGSWHATCVARRARGGRAPIVRTSVRSAGATALMRVADLGRNVLISPLCARLLTLIKRRHFP